MSKTIKNVLSYFALPIAFLFYEIAFMLLLNIFSIEKVFLLLLFSLFLGAIINTLLIFVKHRRIIINVLVIVFAIIYLTEIIIYKFFGNFMSLKYIIEQSTSVVSVYSGTIIKLIKNNIFAIFLYVAFIIFFMMFINTEDNLNKKKVLLTNSLIVVLYIIIFLNIIITKINGDDFNSIISKYGFTQGYLFSKVSSNADVTFYSENNNENQVVSEKENTEKVITFNKLDIDFDMIEEENPSDEVKALNEYVKNKTASEKNDYTGIFAGKNLIMICAESFSKYVANEELTPTLYRLINNGFYFDKYYTPKWGGSTGTGEFAFLTGLIPASWNTSLYSTVKKDMSFNLPSQLKKIGYNTFSYHNGEYKFYNRDKTYPNLGFDSYMANGNGLEKYMTNMNDDIDMFNKTVDFYKDKAPFCVYYMTYAGHFPYDVDSDLSDKYIDKIKSFYKDKYDGIVNNYLAKEMWLEDSLNMLLKRLEEEGLLDDTVICLTSDHYPYGLDGDNAVEYQHMSNLTGMEINNNNFQYRDANNLIIWSKEIEEQYADSQKTIGDVTYSIDIEPTMLNLFGIDFDSRLFPGRDVFAKNISPIVIYNNGSFLTNEFKYNKAFTNKAFDDNGNVISVDIDIIEETKKTASNRVEYSTIFVKNDYYKLVKKSLEKSTK